MSGAAPAPGASALRERLRGQRWIARLVQVDSVDSTNDELRRLAVAGASAGTVVLANHQSHGRGRLGRGWDSPRGLGLYISVLFRPTGPAEEVTRWTLAGAVAACEACRALGAGGVEIDWPNDLVHDGRKLGGVLVEMRSQGDRATDLVLGTGLNLAQRRGEFPPRFESIATSLAEVLGRPADRTELAVRYLEQLGELAGLLLRDEWTEVAERWNRLAPGGNGRRVRVRRPGGDGEQTVQCGTTCGLDEQGGLQVLLDHAGIESVRLLESVEPLES